tara:strand:- start:1537 stop:2193 length:657 start_codon:yes stop_codon:yes gene_type:complete
MNLVDFWTNNTIVSIIIIAAVAVVIFILIYIISRIPRKSSEEKEEQKAEKELNDAIDLFDKATPVSQLQNQINRDKELLADWEHAGSMLQTQMDELTLRGKDKEATNFDKTNWAYQYQSAKLKMETIELNIAETNNSLLYVESVKWLRENEQRMTESKVYNDLKTLSPDHLVQVTQKLKKDAKAIDLPIDQILPSSGEIISGRKAGFHEYMKKIESDS